MTFQNWPAIIRCFVIFFLLNSHITAQEKDLQFLDMETAINRALSLNNQVRSSDYAVQQATWGKRHAWSLLFPVLTFNSNYTWIDDSTFVLRDFSRYFNDPNSGFQIPQTVFQESYRSSLDLSMPLFNGALLNGVSIANANEDMYLEQNQYMRDNIIYLVIKNYLNVLKERELLKLQNEYLMLSKLNYEKALRLFKAGRWSKTDALRWQIEFQKQKSFVVNSDANVVNTIAAFNSLLSIKLNQNIKIEEKIPESLETEINNIQNLEKKDLWKLVELSDDELITANAALNANQFGNEVSRLQYRNSFSAYMPNISLAYSHAWRENNTIELDDYSPKTLMVNLSIPLFSSFQNFTALKSSYYAYKKNQENFYDQIKNTRFVLTQTVNKILNIKTQLELSALNVEFNELNYRTVEIQREKGLVSNIDFVDAKINLQNALLENVSNRYDFISGVVELYYLLGKIDKMTTK